MTGAEKGFLLLTSQLGDPDRRPLTVAEFRDLTRRITQLTVRQRSGHVSVRELVSVGYSEAFAWQVVSLLQGEKLLEYYLLQAKKAGCIPITRASENYPLSVRKRMGLDSPGVLWTKGDASLLQRPKVALVGSRDLQSENAAFAEEVGRQAARQGYTLVSGNARGADKLAQNACLRAGGSVISVVADSLLDCTPAENMLYISENSFDAAFSARRALSRNCVIHTLGYITFVAQAGLRQGGTWDGTEKNLRYGWSPVYCYADDSITQRTLVEMGACPICMDQLENFSALPKPVADIFTMEEII